MRWQIISYPRSGNHAVRAIVERYSGRPTMGCPGSRRDIPIYLRAPNLQTGTITLHDSTPIAYKAHFLHQIAANDKIAGHPTGIVPVTRDPAMAIASHVYRSVRRRHFGIDKTLRRMIPSAIDAYLALIYFYRSLDKRPRIHVQFEDILSAEEARRLNTVCQLLGRMGLPDDEVDVESLAQVLSVSRDSQESLNRPKKNLLAQIQKNVEELLNYDDALGLLAESGGAFIGNGP